MSEQRASLPKLVLVDGSSFLFRAFYALPPLKGPDGSPTGAIHGVLNMLQKLVSDYQPEKMVVIFDSNGKNFRHELFEPYKANRLQMPDDLRVQIEPLQKLIQLLGYSLLIEPGVEADDVIGTLSRRYESDHQVMIATGDKDIAQLIGPTVTIVDTMKNQVIDADYVMTKFGVKPDQMIDYLSLAGDSADNIPGVVGVGPKTAAKWLNTYGDLQTLLDNRDQIKGKAGEKLQAAAESMPLYQKLVTIKTDLDFKFDDHQLAFKEPDKVPLVELLEHFGLTRILKAVTSDEPTSVPSPGDHPYVVIDNLNEWKAWVEKIQSKQWLSIDTETTHQDPMQAELVGISFCIAQAEAAYLPLAHHVENPNAQLNMADVKQDLQAILANPNIKKIGQNIKYDYKVLRRAGFALDGIAFDTMIASFLLDNEGRHNLETLAKKYLNQDMIHFDQVMEGLDKTATFADVPVDKATHYAAEDADMTYRLYEHLHKALEQDKALVHVFEAQEMPLLTILADMELCGILIDKKRLQRQGDKLKQNIALIEADIFKEVGHDFNLSSPKQLQQILFEQLGLPVVKKTPKGQPSTSEEVLVELGYAYDLPKKIVKHRHFLKLLSTYVDKLPQQADAKTHRVHTSYHQAITSTGRLSSTQPNLQNIPIRTEEGRQIRQAFIAKPGCVLLAADYSQVELRIMAHLSQDKGLLEAFNAGEDVHASTAAEVFATTKDQVSFEQRRSAKAINFGLIYGMSAFGLAKQLRIPRAEAQVYIDRYFKRFPGVLDYMNRTREQASAQGFVETLLGRKMFMPDIHAANGRLRQAAERAAINAPMQGTAADIIKQAMIQLKKLIEQDYPECQLLLQVHDELVFEVPEAQLQGFSQVVKNTMEHAVNLTVPLLVDLGTGSNWDEAH